MPRAARKKSESGIYHVMLRGSDRKLIFMEDSDCEQFINILRKVKEVSEYELYALCLMGNHVHMLLKENEEPLEILFKRVGVSYAAYFNRKYDLHGHLFQDRFRSEPVTTDEYFMDVLRYICQNPVKAGLTEDILEYRWLECSGVRETRGLTDPVGQYTLWTGDELLEFIRKPGKTAHIDYLDFKRLTDNEAMDRLKQAVKCHDVQEIAGWEEQQRRVAVKAARGKGISIRQLSRLTGISKTVIERLEKS